MTLRWAARSGRAAVKVAAIALPAVAGFLVLEVAARVTHPFGPSPWLLDGELGYEYRPHAYPEINGDGLRGAPVPVPKRPGVHRLAVIGDSCAFDLDIPWETSWPVKLQQLLARDGTREVEIINAGIPGYVSAQAALRLQRRVLKYRPDLVIVFVGWNDLNYSQIPQWKPNVTLAGIPQGYDWLQRRRTIAGSRFLAVCWYRVVASWRADTVYRTKPSKRPPTGIAFNEQALDLYLRNLETIRLTTERAGARLAVVAWPSLLQVTPAERVREVEPKLHATFRLLPWSWDEWQTGYARYQDAIRRFAAQKPSVILLDPTPAFRAAKDGEGLFADMVHFTPAGSELLAQTLADELRMASRERAHSGNVAGLR
ncbi:MAG: SGNH/GDSL hydrolase family protein [Verrucomicrobiota bacterium]